MRHLKIIDRIKQKINTFSAKTIESSINNAVKKQPKGALTFQYRVFNGKVDLAEVNALKNRFGLSDVYLLHGVAMNVNGKSVVLTGPRGSGKTTVLRRLIKSKKASAIDDGITLVGVKDGKFFVIESGTYHWRKLRANIKRFSPFKSNQIARFGLRTDLANVQRSAIYEGAFSEKIASVLTKNYSKQRHNPKLVRLDKIIRVVSKDDLHAPLKVVSDNIVNASGDKFAENTIEISSNQPRSKIIDKMLKESLI